MTRYSRSIAKRAALAFGLTFVAASGLAAQTRIVIPEGTVLTVRTDAALNSSTAQVGQTFQTTVADTVRVDGFAAIPEGSKIQGAITYVRKADRQNSGVIGVDFERLTLPNGTSFAIDGKLTSTDPAERRQIDAQGGEVVLVGGRGGVGGAIAAGGGSSNDPLSGLLGALGTMLSQGVDVRLPAGTVLAVQLEQGLSLTVRGQAQDRPADAFTIYTSAEMIRAAQQELARRDYYRGPVNGQLNDATQQALFEFQIDQRILATGNLDGRTAQALGLTAAGASALTPDEASLLRRSAQVLAGRYRDEIGIAATGRLNARRSYTAAELELWFGLSAFAENAGLYEQLVRSSGNAEGATLAGEALINAAERVDAAMLAARASARIANAWSTIQETLASIDPEYATGN